MPVEIDMREFHENWLGRWSDSREDFYLYRYIPFNSGKANSLSKFMIAVKNEDTIAVHYAALLIRQALDGQKSALRLIRRCKYLMCIPPSRGGPTKSTYEELCRKVAEPFDWLTHIPNALVRTRTVRSSHTYRSTDRPTADVHYNTIRYVGPPIQPEAGILLFDDIYTRGETSKGCRQRLLDDTDCGSVTGIFLGKTGVP
jgi:predicted amidophosphoribosyltransferase